MSKAIKKVVLVAGTITLLCGASQLAVLTQTLPGPETPVASMAQQSAKLKSINQEVRVPLRNRLVVLHVYLPQQVTAKASPHSTPFDVVHVGSNSYASP